MIKIIKIQIKKNLHWIYDLTLDSCQEKVGVENAPPHIMSTNIKSQDNGLKITIRFLIFLLL